MTEYLLYAALGCFAIFAAIALPAAIIGVTHLLRQHQTGYLHLGVYGILLISAIKTLFSNRVLANNSVTPDATPLGGLHPIPAWGQRAVSVFLIMMALERIIHYLQQHKSVLGPAPLLTLAYIGFWFGTVASPMFFGEIPTFAHERFYTLLIGWGALCLNKHESDLTIIAARNGLFLTMIGGYMVAPINPSFVFDLTYSQGLIPGLPRFAGLAPHPVFLGMLTQMALFSLWVQPFARSWLNRCAWGIGFLTLFLAQSKTAWVSFIPCALTMFVCIHGRQLLKRMTDSRYPEFGISILISVCGLMILVGSLLLFGDLDAKLDHFFNSDEGAQITSLTGRDKIWAVAFAEWHRNPVFGYGLNLFDEDFRAMIGMSAATHGHNQFIDVLARSGLIGAISLIIYALALLVYALRYAISSQGLSITLFLALALRSVSEVPMTLHGYGVEFVGHMMLLIVIAGQTQQQKHSTKPVKSMIYHPANCAA
jgi:hypothetical protein